MSNEDGFLPEEIANLVRSNITLLDIFLRSSRANGTAHFGKEGNCVNIWRDMCLLASVVCEGEEDG